MNTNTKQVVSATISATVTRADGTVEHLGVIDAYKRPRYKGLLAKLKGHSLWRP